MNYDIMSLKNIKYYFTNKTSSKGNLFLSLYGKNHLKEELPLHSINGDLNG